MAQGPDTSAQAQTSLAGSPDLSPAQAPVASPNAAQSPAVGSARPPADDTRLVWVDMEMTGLEPERDRIIEIAIIVTDAKLNVLAEAPVYAIHQSDEVLAGMDDWNQKTHGGSGLIGRVKASTVTEAQAEAELIAFLQQWIGKGKAPMCGNTVHQDRRFMVRYMPQLEAFFHYRNIDVSTIKELCKRWRADLMGGFKKRGAHTALADIQESIDELKYYREHFLRASQP